MGIGIGDIVAEGLIGAAGGAGQAVYDQAALEQKQQMEMLREARLSALRVKEHAANVQTDIAALPQKLGAENDAAVARAKAMLPVQGQQEQQKSDVEYQNELRKPRVIAPGSTEVIPGTPPRADASVTSPDQTTETGMAANGVPGATPGTPATTYTAPEKQKTPEEQEEYKAHAAYYNALADSVRNGDRKKTEKPATPNIKTETNKDTGQTTLVDANSGAIGTVVPGQDPVPAKTHWFKPDDPGKPAVPTHVEWRDGQGNLLPGGIEDLYPAMKQRNDTGRAGIVSSAQRAPATKSATVDQSASTAVSGISRPMTKEDFDALPKGAQFINPKDGRIYTKN